MFMYGDLHDHETWLLCAGILRGNKNELQTQNHKPLVANEGERSGSVKLYYFLIAVFG